MFLRASDPSAGVRHGLLSARTVEITCGTFRMALIDNRDAEEALTQEAADHFAGDVTPGTNTICPPRNDMSTSMLPVSPPASVTVNTSLNSLIMG
jgi:hypothetical protein